MDSVPVTGFCLQQLVSLMAEFEAKFLIQDPTQVRRLIAHFEACDLEFRAQPAIDIVDRYLDTSDWTLLRAGWCYRWRDESGKLTIGLKSVAGGSGLIQIRQEVDQRVATFPDNSHRLPDGSVARRLSRVDLDSLHELFRVQNHRQLYDLRTQDGARIEMAIDQVRITGSVSGHGDKSNGLEFQELELELKDGHEDVLRNLAADVEQRFDLQRSDMSKFDRGLEAAGWTPPGNARPGNARSSADQEEHVRCVLQPNHKRLRADDHVGLLVDRCLARSWNDMLDQEEAASAGTDPEGVHQMRVAIRRIRAALRAFCQQLSPDFRKRWNREFKWLAGILGEVRDLDVYRSALQSYIAMLPAEDAGALAAYDESLARLWKTARHELVIQLAGPRYQRLRKGFADALQQEILEPSDTAQAGRSCSSRDLARRLIDTQYRKVIRAGRSIKKDSPGEALHALRIQCKRLRYLFEFFEPIYGRSFRSLIRKLKKLQDVLGRYQDARVATERAREFAANVAISRETRSQLVAVGQLIRIQHVDAVAARAGFQKAWSRFDRKRQRKRLRTILHG